MRIAKLPYLNCVPFYASLALPPGRGITLVDCVPREAAAKLSAGELDAGPVPLADFLRQRDGLDRLGRLGIAVRGQVKSAMLFSKLPIRQLDGRVVAVTEQSSMTACLLRLLLERRYGIRPAEYVRADEAGADAQLLIGDDALRLGERNTRYPYEIDIGMEWWLWQHAPCVFAVWAVKRGAAVDDKRGLEAALAKALAGNLGRLDALAREHAPPRGLTPDRAQAYLAAFVYRFGADEERSIDRFAELADATGVLIAEARAGAAVIA
ncbi:MAG TPA: menaquinone biosynthesis protein [bacterium]